MLNGIFHFEGRDSKEGRKARGRATARRIPDDCNRLLGLDNMPEVR